MASLSVVLATYNEEENLKKCLESVQDLCNEIIVVDGGSGDKTVEIAKQFNAKVCITDNPPIFHINKQKAIYKATCDWILQLDADEQVTEGLAAEIKEKIKNIHVNGYWIPRKNFFLGRYLLKGGQYPDYTLRLYRKGKGKLPQKSVHEQAVVDGKCEYLVNPLIHMADTNFKRYIIRFGRYTDLIAVELKKKNNKSLILGIQYLLVLPPWWFLKTYIRHKGFMDSWQGLVFSFFSSLRFPVGYIKSLST
ncbi:MAG: hypothetical protein A3J14_01975 [Candidatus Levybacteria bacterium RIFCSPLOWO2_02_FULL_37_18]|nr:MAG: hypothetical protein A3J14_01975 [Candidatus Levybacteria bacterium RIFCSPLOWO2_02_FULL_37_18]